MRWDTRRVCEPTEEKHQGCREWEGERWSKRMNGKLSAAGTSAHYTRLYIFFVFIIWQSAVVLLMLDTMGAIAIAFFRWFFLRLTFLPLSLSISLPLPLSPFFFFPSLLPHAKNLMNRHRIIFCLFPSPEKFARSHSTCSKLHSLLQKCEAFVFVILRVSWWVFFSSIVSLFSYIFLVCLVFSLISFLVFFIFPWFCRKIVSDNLYYAAPSYLLSLD